MKRLYKKILNRILNYVLSNYFHALTEEDIFVLDKKDGRMYLKGKEVDPSYNHFLSEQAEKILDSKMWHIIKNECEYQANIKMFKSSGRDMDMLFGKAMLHTLKVMDIKLQSLAKLQ